LTIDPVRGVEELVVAGLHLHILPPCETPTTRHKMQTATLELGLEAAICEVCPLFRFLYLGCVRCIGWGLRGMVVPALVKTAVKSIGRGLRHIIRRGEWVQTTSSLDVNLGNSVRRLQGLK
jgi:hypothetical protein